MKNKENFPLLTEVLDEAAPPEFQAMLFEKTMRAARQRKRNRQWGGALLTAACLALGVCLLVPGTPVTEQVRVESTRPSLLTVVHSQSLPAEAIVRTQPFSVGVISSGEFVSLVSSGKAKDLFTTVDDEELLALLSGRPVALVYHAPGDAELILLDGDGM